LVDLSAVLETALFFASPERVVRSSGEALRGRCPSTYVAHDAKHQSLHDALAGAVFCRVRVHRFRSEAQSISGVTWDATQTARRGFGSSRSPQDPSHAPTDGRRRPRARAFSAAWGRSHEFPLRLTGPFDEPHAPRCVGTVSATTVIGCAQPRRQALRARLGAQGRVLYSLDPHHPMRASGSSTP
jgi:hypothetical protein